MAAASESTPSERATPPTPFTPFEAARKTMSEPADWLKNKLAEHRSSTDAWAKETTPLMEHKRVSRPRRQESAITQAEGSLQYNASSLALWTYCFTATKTVFGSRTLWWTVLKLVGLILLVACLVYFLVSDPLSIQVSKFSKISTFLNVFVGLLISFFVASSVGRWYNCVNGFLELLDAIRNIQMQLSALGVPREKVDLAIRYGYLSAWLLNVDLHILLLAPSQQQEALAAVWDLLNISQSNRATRVSCARSWNFARRDPLTCMTQNEVDVLRSCEDPAGMMWMWVASLIGRLAQDKIIPPMASPTYGRIMNLCQDAHGGIRNVRASIAVQAPYVYIHLLATLVHINNIVNAIGFGLTIGVSLGVLSMRWGYRHAPEKMNPRVLDHLTQDVISLDAQDVVVSFFCSMVGPFFYQAILEISIGIAQPFATQIASIPMTRLLDNLAQDVEDGMRMCDDVTWEKPCFAACV